MRHEDFQAFYLKNYICRDCLNAATGLSLKSSDCHHEAYPRKCQFCGDVRYLIRGLHRSGRWKILFFRPKKAVDEALKK